MIQRIFRKLCRWLPGFQSGLHPIYTDEDRWASFVIISHMDKVNCLLQNYGEQIHMSDIEKDNYVRTGRIPMRIASVAYRYRSLLLQHLHEFVPRYMPGASHISQAVKFIDVSTRDILSKYVQDWPLTREGIPYRYFHDYVPVGTSGINHQDYYHIRRLVWDFKYAHDNVTPYNHVKALCKVYEMVAQDILSVFGEDASKLTLFCVPASTHEKTWLRYCEFSRLLCRHTGMTDSFSYVSMMTDRTPKHEGGYRKDNYVLDTYFFNGKFVLMFDDVITTGESLNMARMVLEKAGATVIVAYSIAKTIKVKNYQ